MDLKRYKKLTKESQKNNPTELEPGIIHDIRNTPEESTVKVAYEQLAFVEEIRKEFEHKLSTIVQEKEGFSENVMEDKYG